MALRHEIQSLIRSLPETKAWPELSQVFDRTRDVAHPDWEIPLRSCEAVGGRTETAIPVAAAIACLQLSIILVDDMLDQDPRGVHLRRGVGPTANLGLAFQAAALRLVDTAPLEANVRVELQSQLARCALATAYGQQLDVQNLQGEANYWRVVAAKSTPFYGCAYAVGALSGGASGEVVAGLEALGILVGEIIQLEDDLEDAFQRPANADWTQSRNNLLLLYARTADHKEREQFEALLPRVADANHLAEAQQILVRCGAVSYVAYQLVQRYGLARRRLAALELARPGPLAAMLDSYAASLRRFLSLSGADLPPDLLEQGPEPASPPDPEGPAPTSRH